MLITPICYFPCFAMVMALFFGIPWVALSGSTVMGKTYLMLMLALAWWSFAVVIEHSSLELSAKLFLGQMSYFGITVIPVAWLIFTLLYTKREKWITRRNLALLLILPVITLIMVWTNGIFHLMWKDIWMNISVSPPMDAVTHNWWFWIHSLYSYSLLLLGNIFLLDLYRKSKGIYRKQAGILLIAAFVPWIANILYIAGIKPFTVVDPTPLAFAVTGLAFLWGLSRLQLLDIIMPIAHDAILQSHG